MDLVAINQQPTMSSREIAELTGKEHRNVMRDIRAMLTELHGEERLLSFEQTVQRPNPSGGAAIPSTVYALPKRETLILVSGYSVAMRARIIDRWQVLEAQAADPMRFLNDPQVLRGLLLGSTEKVMELEGQVKQLAPKADALDLIATHTEGSLRLRDAAANLQMPERKFLQRLEQKQWIYRGADGTWHAYAEARKKLYVEHKLHPYVDSKDGETKYRTQVRVTARGMANLSEIFVRDAA